MSASKQVVHPCGSRIKFRGDGRVRNPHKLAQHETVQAWLDMVCRHNHRALFEFQRHLGGAGARTMHRFAALPNVCISPYGPGQYGLTSFLQSGEQEWSLIVGSVGYPPHEPLPDDLSYISDGDQAKMVRDITALIASNFELLWSADLLGGTDAFIEARQHAADSIRAELARLGGPILPERSLMQWLRDRGPLLPTTFMAALITRYGRLPGFCEFSKEVMTYEHPAFGLHRDDGPAVISVDGYEEWFWENRHHRDDGPAIYSSNPFSGEPEYWFVAGVEVDPDQWLTFRADHDLPPYQQWGDAQKVLFRLRFDGLQQQAA